MKMDPVHVIFCDILHISYNVDQSHLLKYGASRINTRLKLGTAGALVSHFNVKIVPDNQMHKSQSSQHVAKSYLQLVGVTFSSFSTSKMDTHNNAALK